MSKPSKTNAIKSAYTTTKNEAPDLLNKIWVLTVFFTLMGAAYVIFMFGGENVPEMIRRYLAGALVVFSLMHLFVNLRSNKNTDVVK